MAFPVKNPELNASNTKRRSRVRQDGGDLYHGKFTIDFAHSNVLIQFKLWIENTFKILYVNKKNYGQKDNSRGYIAPPVNMGWRTQQK